MYIMEWDVVNCNRYGNMTAGSHIGFFINLGVLAIYMVKLEMPVRKLNGSHHSVWEASKNMGCDLRQCNFSTLFSLFSQTGYFFVTGHSPTKSNFIVLCLCKISTGMICVNGKCPCFCKKVLVTFASSFSNIHVYV